MALIYIFRRIFTSKPSPPMEEVMETIKEERDGEDIEFAAIAAVIAYVTTPRATVAYVERVQEPTPSLWKISSILNSSRFKEVG